MKKLLIFIVSATFSMISYGEDIELYVSSKVKSAAKKPKVLIILDNSGSMRTEESVKDDYDPSAKSRFRFYYLQDITKPPR